MLSILIPTFNTSIIKLTEELHSQVKQCNVAFEIIVCDDASTKEYVENKKIEELSNCRYLKNKENKGRATTRTILTKNATYDWILFLDADVLPTSIKFIKNYIEYIQQNSNVECIYGGLLYQERIPPQNELLRWKYGRKKETKSACIRSKKPYVITSANILFKKTFFLSIPIENSKMYGLDNIYSSKLKEMNTQVIHIDNQVYHLGLESNEIFLEKSIDALKTSIEYEKTYKNLRPIQRVYNRLHFFLGSHKLIAFIIGLFKTQIKANLMSKNPSILLFDFYRLYHYIQLKSNA